MRRPLYLALLLPLFLLLHPFTAAGAWGEAVYPKGQEITQDLISANDKVIVESTVNGDMIAAGNTVRNSGHITNDFLALGWYIHHRGRVEGSSRLAASRMIIDGATERNLSAVGYKLDFSSDSIIRGNLTAVGANILFDGKAEGKLIVRAGVVTIGGEIGKDVEIYANSLTILPTAKFHGAVTYFGPKPAVVNPAAQFTSPLAYKPSSGKPWQKLFYRMVRLLLLALLVAGLVPRGTIALAQKLVHLPGRNLLFGTGIFLCTPPLAFLLAWFRPGRLSATLLVTLFVSLSITGFFLAQVLWGAVVGRQLWGLAATKLGLPAVGPNTSVILQTTAGTLLVGLLCQIPYAGVILGVGLTASCCGLLCANLFKDVPWRQVLPTRQQAKGV